MHLEVLYCVPRNVIRSVHCEAPVSGPGGGGVDVLGLAGSPGDLPGAGCGCRRSLGRPKDAWSRFIPHPNIETTDMNPTLNIGVQSNETDQLSAF